MTSDTALPLADLKAFFAFSPRSSPAALYTQLREFAPVVFFEGMALVTRWDEVREVYGDPLTYSSEGKSRGSRFDRIIGALRPELADSMRRIAHFERLYMVQNDGEVHRRLRKASQRIFTSRRIAELADDIRTYSLELGERLRGGEPVDFIENFAYQLPVRVISKLLGIPMGDAEHLSEWANLIGQNRLGANPDSLLQVETAISSFKGYCQSIVESQRTGGSEPTALTTLLLEAQRDGSMSDDELVAMFVLLLFAGHETTTNLLGNGLIALLKNGSQWDLLCRSPEALASRSVEELLRYDPPIHMQVRVTTRAATLGGIGIPADHTVVTMIGSANRDPRHHVEPDELNILRDHVEHMSFGHGHHFCLGAALARLEGVVAFEMLAREFPNLALSSDPEDWKSNSYLRGLRSLRVELR